VELNIRLLMGVQADATQMVNGHVVPLVAGAVTVMITANVKDAPTSGYWGHREQTRDVDLNIRLMAMGNQPNATHLVNGHVVPLVTGAVTLNGTANVIHAPTPTSSMMVRRPPSKFAMQLLSLPSIATRISLNLLTNTGWKYSTRASVAKRS